MSEENEIKKTSLTLDEQINYIQDYFELDKTNYKKLTDEMDNYTYSNKNGVRLEVYENTILLVTINYQLYFNDVLVKNFLTFDLVLEREILETKKEIKNTLETLNFEPSTLEILNDRLKFYYNVKYYLNRDKNKKGDF